QLTECFVKRRRGVLSREVQSRGPGEHRVVERRVLRGEAAVSAGNPADLVVRRGATATGGAQRRGELAKALQGNSFDDVVHRPEMLVEHRLAVLDLGGQPACGDRVPA